MDNSQWINDFTKIEFDQSKNLVTYLPWKLIVPKCQKWYLNKNEELYSKSFLDKVDGIDTKDPVFVSNQCNIWTGATYETNGYMRGKYNPGTPIDAHRYMFLLTYGIPKSDTPNDSPCPCGSGKIFKQCCKIVIRHRCIQFTGENNQGVCVNPLHLCIGDTLANMHDIREDGTGRGKISRGDNHPNAKITEEKACYIWADIHEYNRSTKIMTLAEIAIKHEVGTDIVKDISCGRTWNEVTGLSNEKRIKNVKRQKDKKIYNEYQRRKEFYESRGLEYVGDIAPKIEDPPKPTSKICHGILCKQLDPNGMELPLECFGWKTSDHIQRRSECIQCKNESLRKYRCHKEEREYVMKTPNHISSNEIDLSQMKCCAGEFCKSRYPDGTPQPLENFLKVNGKPAVYCKTCKQEKDRQSYERRKKSTIDEKQPINVTSIKLNCPVGCKYCKTCENYLPIDRFPGSSTNTKRVQIIMDCTECRKMNAKKSKAASAKKIAEAKKRKAESTAPEQPEKKKSRNE